MADQRQRFPRAARLSGKLAFAAVYAAKVKVGRWPLVVYSLPNGLPTLRLGLSVSRAVGTAVRRNRIKRLVREAFRVNIALSANAGRRRERGMDMIVVVRPHEPRTLGDYQRLFGELLDASEAAWSRRQAVD